MVFAASGGGGQTKMYDVRAYEKGPFATFAPDAGGPIDFSSVKFSHDGKLMLLGTAQGKVLLLDAFTGDLIRAFTGHSNSERVPLEACFSPDAEYVLGGSEDGSIWRWQTSNGQPMPPLTGHTGPVSAIKCNPTRMLFASACSLLCMWLPTPQPSGGF